MELDTLGDFDRDVTSDHFHDIHETVVMTCPEESPSAVETALAQYADSMDMFLGADPTTVADPYTRGFVAGLRAALKVAANVNRP